MLVVIMYWGGCDYNRGHVPLLPVSPFSINCNCYLFFIALYWYIFVMLINPQFSSVQFSSEDGWESLADRRRHPRLILLYEIISHPAAVSVDSILIRADSRTRANHQFKYKHTQANTTVFRNSFFVATIIIIIIIIIIRWRRQQRSVASTQSGHDDEPSTIQHEC